MFGVLLSDLQKVSPDFKEEQIAQLSCDPAVRDYEAKDTLLLHDGAIIVITNKYLEKYKGEYEYFGGSGQVLYRVPCIQKRLGPKDFHIFQTAEDRTDAQQLINQVIAKSNNLIKAFAKANRSLEKGEDLDTGELLGYTQGEVTLIQELVTKLGEK